MAQYTVDQIRWMLTPDSFPLEVPSFCSWGSQGWKLESFGLSSFGFLSFCSFPRFASLPSICPERKWGLSQGALRLSFQSAFIKSEQLEFEMESDWSLGTPRNWPASPFQVLRLKVCTSVVWFEFKNLMAPSHKCSHCFPLVILHCDKDIRHLVTVVAKRDRDGILQLGP